MPNNQIDLDQWNEFYFKVYNYFYKRVNGKYEVEELTAQTMNTAFLAKINKEIIFFDGYLWKVAHNYLVKYIKTKNLSPMMVGLDENTESIKSDPVFEIDQDVEDLKSNQYQSKLDQLIDCIDSSIKNDEDKTIIRLSIYEEKTAAQIGEVFNLTKETVRQRLSRNIRKIRQSCLDVWNTLNAKQA
jgi:RNA polymerase sigma factor (sigma-70 family)